MTFERVIVDVIRYLAAFTATEDVQHISAARQSILACRREFGLTPELMDLWSVTLAVQRQILQVGA